MDAESRFTSIDCRVMACKVHVFGRISSTNQKAVELATEGAAEGTVVVAEEQAAGRGRLGRAWSSAKGGLYLSVILRPDLTPGEVTVLPLLAGLAVSKSISTSCGIVSSLKWPNDVLIGERKVSGVLCESSYSGTELKYVVVGIGINVNNDPALLTGEVRDRATSLRSELGRDVDIGVVYRDLMYNIDMLYGRMFEEGARSILDDWTARSSTIGKDVRVDTADGVLEGKALGVDGSGALVLKIGSRLTVVESGDVVHLR